MAKIVKLSELNKKEREKLLEQTKKEVAERKAQIESEISFASKNNSNNNNVKLPTVKTTTKLPIANNTSDKENKAWYEKILQKPQVFDDGYQFGDVTKTIGGTLLDVGTGLAKGAIGLGEGIGKGLAYGVAQVADWTGNDEKADKLRKKIADEPSPLTGKITEWQDKNVDTHSVLGDTSDSASEGIGQMLALGGIGKVAGGLTKGAKAIKAAETARNATMFASAAGHSLADSYKNEDIEDWQAWTRALGSGYLAYKIESLGGIFSKGGADKAVREAATQNMKSSFAKIATRILGTGFAEGGEEALEYVANQALDRGIDVANKMASNNKATLSEEWDWDEFWTGIFAGTVAGTSMGSVQTLARGTNIKKQNPNMNLKQVVDQISHEQEIEGKLEDLEGKRASLEEELGSKKLTQTEINDIFTEMQQLDSQIETLKKTFNTENIQNKVKTQQNNIVENNQETLYNNNERESGINDTERNNNKFNETEEIISNQAILSENANASTDNEVSKELYEQNRKEIENILKQEIKSNYGFEDNVTNNIYEKISKKENITREDIYEAFNDYREISGEDVSDDIKQTVNEIKRLLRTTKIDTSVIKGEISDYRDLYRHNFNRVSMGNDGIAIDSLYKELVQTFPGYFDENITNPTDQLLSIIEWRDVDAEELLKPTTYTLTDSDLEDTVNTILTYQEYLNSIKPKDSNKSSFIMPTPEKTIYRTEEQIANDRTIDDLEAIQEASKHVNTPSLQIAQKTENELKNKGIEKSPTIDYIKKKRSKGKVSTKEIIDTLAQRFVNKGHYIDKLANKTGNKNLTYLYDRTMNVFNEAQISIGDYQINSKGEVVGDSIISIFQPSIDAGLELEFEDYLLNKHNISRYNYEKGLYGNEISAIDSADTVLKYENAHPEFKEWAKAVNKYNDNNLKDLVSNGMISQQTYEKLKEMYGDYVPTYRDIVDNISQYEDNAIGSNPIKKATQSDRDILSIKESMAEQTIMQKKAIRMNNLGLELYKTIGKDNIVLEGIEVDPLSLQTIGGDVIEKATDGSNIFTIFKEGEMIQFKISDELYTAFSKDTLQNKINNSNVAKVLLTPAEKLSKAQRELLTTYSVGFSMTNPIKDFGYALFTTKYSNLRFVKNYVKALYNLGTKGSWYKAYKNNGGTANTYFDYEKGILPTKSRGFASKIKKVNNIMEQAPRLAEFISTIETGGNIDEALYNATEITVNFKRGGDITKVLNKYGFNFLNASVQGLDKIYRDVTNQNGWKGYARLITRATIFQIGPAIINSLLLGDDDDYQDLPEYIKDNYYLFKMGNGKFFRIPKDRISAVVGGIARRTLETAQGKEVDWGSIIDTTINNLAPNSLKESSVLAPIEQAITNKAWYGGDIVSSRLKKLPVAEQYDESTDELSKWLGEKVNISPKKINYVLDQYSGGIGDIFLPIMTPQAENNIIEDKFSTDAVIKNKNVSKYYEQLEELEKRKNSYKATDKDILKYKYFSDNSSDISDLYTEKRKIQNLDISDKEKKEQVRKIQEQINALVENKLDTVNNINISGDTAKINETEYYKYNDEWTVLTDKEKEKNKDISLKTYSDYKNKVYNQTQKKKAIGELKGNESLKDADKIGILLSSNYSDREIAEIYDNYIKSSNDTQYSAVKASGIDIKEYLKYKQQDFESDKKDDGTLEGKSKRNTKEKVTKYLNSMNIKGNQRLLLYAMRGYSMTSSQKTQLARYVQGLDLNKQDKLELYDKFSGFTVYKNGTIKW